MPMTRIQWIKSFEAPDFGEPGTYFVLRFILYSTDRFDGLETVEGMEDAIRYVHQRYLDRNVRCYSAQAIKEKVIALRRRYTMFNRFVTLPGVYYDDYTHEIITFGEEYNDCMRRENVIEKYFRLYGFPDYEMHRLVFDVCRAAVFSKERIGTLTHPLELIDSDPEEDDDGDIVGENGAGGDDGSDDDGTVTQA